MIEGLAIGIALCLGILAFHRCVIGHARRILRRWADENHFELLHFERCFFTGGFSPSTTSRNQIVYFVRVRDREHRERSGWVRCGSFAHPFGKGAEVEWKDSQG